MTPRCFACVQVPKTTPCDCGPMQSACRPSPCQGARGVSLSRRPATSWRARPRLMPMCGHSRQTSLQMMKLYRRLRRRSQLVKRLLQTPQVRNKAISFVWMLLAFDQQVSPYPATESWSLHRIIVLACLGAKCDLLIMHVQQVRTERCNFAT